jgi:ABC-type amino acid transport substrate-binding protein
MTTGRIFVAFVAVAVLADGARADLKDIKAEGVLRVLRMDAPAEDEFLRNDAGDSPGFDREMLEGFARLHQLKIALVTVPSWEDLAPALLANKGHVAAGRFTATDNRRKKIDFTIEVFPTRHVVVTRKPRRVVLTFDELRTEKLVTVRGSAVEEAILAAGVPKPNITYVAVRGATLSALKEGRVTAAVNNVENAIRDRRQDPELQLGMFLGPARSLAYGVRKDDVELRKALDEYIDGFRRSASWSRLVVKYFGQDGLDILKSVRE